jgi:hypothetical protein
VRWQVCSSSCSRSASRSITNGFMIAAQLIDSGWARNPCTPDNP